MSISPEAGQGPKAPHSAALLDGGQGCGRGIIHRADHLPAATGSFIRLSTTTKPHVSLPVVVPLLEDAAAAAEPFGRAAAVADFENGPL